MSCLENCFFLIIKKKFFFGYCAKPVLSSGSEKFCKLKSCIFG